MEKKVKEIMRGALVELGKIMVEAFDAGVNMDYDARDAGSDKPWITGYISLEGWTKVSVETKDIVFKRFEIYDSLSEDEVREKLETIRKMIADMSQYEIRKVETVLPR